MYLSPVIQAITGLFLIGFIVRFSYKIIRFDYTFGCELCNADDNGVKALKFKHYESDKSNLAYGGRLQSVGRNDC